MTNLSDLKQDDHVRVVVEGKVLLTGNNTCYIGTDNSNYTVFNAIRRNHVVSVEKMDPPVVEFKPGDRVRHTITKDEFTIAKNGWISHQTGRVYLDDGFKFTSEHYEKVD